MHSSSIAYFQGVMTGEGLNVRLVFGLSKKQDLALNTFLHYMARLVEIIKPVNIETRKQIIILKLFEYSNLFKLASSDL